MKKISGRKIELKERKLKTHVIKVSSGIVNNYKIRRELQCMATGNQIKCKT